MSKSPRRKPWASFKANDLRSFGVTRLDDELDVDQIHKPSMIDEGDDEMCSSIASENDTFHSKLKAVLNSPKTTCLIGFFIALNALFIGLELDQDPRAAPRFGTYSLVTIRGIPQSFFDAFEFLFFFVFGIEFVCRAIVYKLAFWKEFGTYVDLLALGPIVLVLGFDLQSSRHLTLLRVVRLVKLCRLFRLFRLCKELNMLAQSIASAMRALVWIGLLLLLTLYCGAIACTMLIGQNPVFAPGDKHLIEYEERYGVVVDTERYWGSMARSMLSLFQIFTLDDWNAIVRPVVETHSPFMLLFFICFVFVTTFGLLNLLMGTIVDRAMHVARESEEEKERLIRDEHNQMMLATVRLFSAMDVDKNGYLSAREINSFLESNDIQTLLENDMAALNIKFDYSTHIEIYQQIIQEWIEADEGNSDGITIEEFTGAASRLQGFARSRDMMTAVVTSKATLNRVEVCEASLLAVKATLESHGEKLDGLLEILGGPMGRSATPRTPLPKESSPFATLSVMKANGKDVEAQGSRRLDEVVPSPRGSVLEEVQTIPCVVDDEVTVQRELISSRRSSKYSASTADDSDVIRSNDSQDGRRGTPHKRTGDAKERPSRSPTMKHNRGNLQRSGTRDLCNLLRDMNTFDDLAKSKMGMAVRDYSDSQSQRGTRSSKSLSMLVKDEPNDGYNSEPMNRSDARSGGSRPSARSGGSRSPSPSGSNDGNNPRSITLNSMDRAPRCSSAKEKRTMERSLPLRFKNLRVSVFS